MSDTSTTAKPALPSQWEFLPPAIALREAVKANRDAQGTPQAMKALADLLAVTEVMCPEVDEDDQYTRPVKLGDVYIDDAYRGHVILGQVEASVAIERNGQPTSLQVKGTHDLDGVQVRGGSCSLAVIPNCGNVVDIIGRRP